MSKELFAKTRLPVVVQSIAACIAVAACGGGKSAPGMAFDAATNAATEQTTAALTASPASTTTATTTFPATISGPNVSATFTSSTADFPNPERGWTVNPTAAEFTNVATLTGFVQQYGTRLFLMREDLGAYRTQSLPQSYLDGLTARFTGVRSAGTKVALRFAYDFNGSGTDATLNWVQTHTTQLKPVLAANADVIADLQAGFIGSFGEWVNGTSGIDNKAGKRGVKDAVMNMAPPSVPVGITQVYPPQEDWFAGQIPLSSAEAFSGSLKSRMGFHSDCFLTGQGDSSFYPGQQTVVDFTIGDSRAQQRAYVEAVSQFAPFGGETCFDSQGAQAQLRTACSGDTDEIGQSGGILNEGPRYHLSYLGYVISGNPFRDAWDSGGCFPTVSRSMGYRFQLDAVSHASTAPAGSAATVNVTLRNVGWARIFSARKLVVTLRNKATGALVSGSAGDLRQIAPGATATIAVPVTAPAGNYDVLVSVPDIWPSTAGDPRQAVRFANADVSAQTWDASTARFSTGTSITVQ